VGRRYQTERFDDCSIEVDAGPCKYITISNEFKLFACLTGTRMSALTIAPWRQVTMISWQKRSAVHAWVSEVRMREGACGL
jgi:hypothetical protein